MKKITLLLFAIGIFTTFGFAVLQGGDDPVPGIDVIIKRRPVPKPIANIPINNEELRIISAYAGEERSTYIAKVITPIIEKVTEEKGLEKIILKGLLETRCIECKSFETFTFNIPSKTKGKGYSVTLNVKFDKKWITVITDRDNFEKPIANPHNFKLIDKVNELESKLKPSIIKELVQSFGKPVYRIDLSTLNTKEEVFKAYIKILEGKTTNSKYRISRRSASATARARATMKKEVKPVEIKKQ